MSVLTPVCLPVCLFVRLFVCLSVCLSICVCLRCSSDCFLAAGVGDSLAGLSDTGQKDVTQMYYTTIFSLPHSSVCLSVSVHCLHCSSGCFLEGDLLPGDVLPGDVLPGDIRPGDIRPGDIRPGDFLAETSNPGQTKNKQCNANS